MKFSILAVLIGALIPLMATTALAKKPRHCHNYEQKMVEHIALEEYGHGPYVILIHGGPGMPGYLSDIATPFCHKFRFVEYSQRDTLDSLHEGPYTVQAHVDDLKMIVERYTVNGEAPILLGQSWGAMLAFYYAGQYDGTVKKIIALSPGYLNMETYTDWLTTLRARLTAIDPALRARARELAVSLPNLVDQPAVYQRTQRELFAITGQTYNKNPKTFSSMKLRDYLPLTALKSNQHLFASLEKGELEAAMAKIKQTPVYSIHGELDVFRPDVLVPVIKANILSADIRVIPEGGHNMWLEGPAVVFALKKALLRALK